MLVARVRDAIDSNGYGVSDVGGRWTVKQGRAKVGTLSYNGNFIGAKLRSGALASISEESANLAKEALARTLRKGWVSQVARSVSKLTD